MNQKVLIIDDDEGFVFILTRILSKTHTVFAAATIQEGMALLQEKAPGCIFLDNQLPDGPGWAKAEYIMANYPNIELNLISALDVPKTTASSFRIIEKQLLLEELRSKV